VLGVGPPAEGETLAVALWLDVDDGESWAVQPEEERTSRTRIPIMHNYIAEPATGSNT